MVEDYRIIIRTGRAEPTGDRCRTRNTESNPDQKHTGSEKEKKE